MFCEIQFLHRQVPTPEEIGECLKSGNLGTELGPDEALSRSVFYSASPPKTRPGFAHETEQGCLVLFLQVHGNKSVHHLERHGRPLSVQQLLEVAADYCRQLTRAFSGGVSTPGTVLAVRLLDNQGEQTGILGRPVTWKGVLRDQFAVKELQGKALALLPTWAVVYFGLEQRSALTISLVSLAIIAGIAVVEFLFKIAANRGTIQFELSSRR
jgi:hypothetical protein